MNVLIHHGALGDWVLTWPLLRALAIDADGVAAVAARSKAELAARLIDRVRAVDLDHPDWSALFGPEDGRERPPHVRSVLAGAGRIISFVADEHDPFTRNLHALAPAARIHPVTARPPADWPGHVHDWHLSQLRTQGLQFASLPTPGVRRNPAGPILIHPGSGGRDKCWPADRFEDLIGRLADRGLPVRVILGEAELDRWPAGRRDRWRRQLGATVLATLSELRDELAAARLFVGNDSGPSHLAAQMGLPTLALFGPTGPRRWRPLGPVVRVLAPPQPGAIEWLTVQAVLTAVRELA